MSIKTAKLTAIAKAIALKAHDLLFCHMAHSGMILGAIDLTDPEVKEAIKAAVEEATAPLIAKRDELLGEVKKARKGQQADPEAMSKLEDQLDAAKAELATAQKAAKTATDAAAKAAKDLQAESGYVQRLLVDNGLSEALAKAGVTNPVHQKAARAMLASQVQIAADGDQRIAKVGDKPLADFIGEWAKGDEGKHFVAAPNNSGGGSQGGSGGGAAKTMTRTAFEALDPAAKSAQSKAGLTLTD
jgi:hypothetical protein